MQMGGTRALVEAGARIHESGCLGCIGMGQAPATGTVSLRTFPRNFKGAAARMTIRYTPLLAGNSRSIGAHRQNH